MAAYDEVIYQQTDPGPAPDRDVWTPDPETELEAEAWEAGAMHERMRIADELLMMGCPSIARHVVTCQSPYWNLRKLFPFERRDAELIKAKCDEFFGRVG